jgi:hypothetical protein
MTRRFIAFTDYCKVSYNCIQQVSLTSRYCSAHSLAFRPRNKSEWSMLRIQGTNRPHVRSVVFCRPYFSSRKNLVSRSRYTAGEGIVHLFCICAVQHFVPAYADSCLNFELCRYARTSITVVLHHGARSIDSGNQKVSAARVYNIRRAVCFDIDPSHRSKLTVFQTARPDNRLLSQKF